MCFQARLRPRFFISEVRAVKKGFARRVDRLGRIVIPKEVRDAFGIVEGTPLLLSVEGDRLVYTKADGAPDVLSAIDDAIAAVRDRAALDGAAASRLCAALAEARAMIAEENN